MYCSFSCAAAHIPNKPFALWALWHRATGNRGLIPKAPPRQRLQTFGGDLTIDDFREHGGQGAVALPVGFRYRRRAAEPRVAKHCKTLVSKGFDCSTSLKAAANSLNTPNDTSNNSLQTILRRPKPLARDKHVMDRLGFFQKASVG